MNKYPYIGKNSSLCGDFSIAIFYGEKRGALLENTIDEIPLHERILDFNEREFKNITAEYLANTYGKVESKEHADFIVKLAESAGFTNRLDYKGESCFFNFYNEGILDFWIDEFSACALGEKKITIPLPPKGKPMESQKEWPQVGDKALTDSREVVEVVAIDNDVACVKHSFCETKYSYLSMRIKMLSKVPTPEEELESKLSALMSSDSCNSCGDIAKAIINGEIEGLEYKPQ